MALSGSEAFTPSPDTAVDTIQQADDSELQPTHDQLVAIGDTFSEQLKAITNGLRAFRELLDKINFNNYTTAA